MVGGVAVVARVLWRLAPGYREQTRSYMSLVLAGTPRSGEVEPMARRLVNEMLLRRAILWRPRMLQSTTVEGAEHLDGALARGRGVILMYSHIGANSFGQGLALARHGYRAHVFAGPWLIRDSYKGDGGWRAFVIRRRYEREGGRFVAPTGGGFEAFRTLLEENKIVILAFDVPGKYETELAGKKAWLRTGTARLADATGAAIVPMFAGREGHRLFLRLEEPIDPAAFDGVDELMQHLARRVGDEILRRPAEREPNEYLARVWTEPEQA